MGTTLIGKEIAALIGEEDAGTTCAYQAICSQGDEGVMGPGDPGAARRSRNDRGEIIIIHNDRWRLNLAAGDPKYDDLERKLEVGPVIAVRRTVRSKVAWFASRIGVVGSAAGAKGPHASPAP